jgi:hypothetical protein
MAAGLAWDHTSTKSAALALVQQFLARALARIAMITQMRRISLFLGGAGEVGGIVGVAGAFRRASIRPWNLLPGAASPPALGPHASGLLRLDGLVVSDGIGARC